MPSILLVIGGLGGLGGLGLGACARPSDATRAPASAEPAPVGSSPTASSPGPTEPPKREPDPEPSSSEPDAAASYAELPAPPEPDAAPPDPYGDPRGWEDRSRAGDPWATDVMKALQAVSPPEAGAETTDVRFTLRVCKDGSVEPTLVGGASGPELKAELLARIGAITVPPPPPHVRAKMESDCARLRYEFRWDGRQIR